MLRNPLLAFVVATALATPLFAAGTQMPYQSTTDRYIAQTPDTLAMIATTLTAIDPTAWKFRTEKELSEFTAAVSEELRIKDALAWQ